MADDLLGAARIRVDMQTDAALLALQGFTRDANGQLRDLQGRFTSQSALIGRALGDSAQDGQRLGGALRGLGDTVGLLGRVAASVGRIGAAAGAALPLVAAVATTVENIAPAAGVAATAALGVASAAAAVKLGMVGVSEAVAAAFDPSDPKAYAKALEKLSPNARAFVQELHAMRPALERLRKDVQDRLFDDLDTVLQRTARATLPALRTSVRQSADTLNLMARSVGIAAADLGKSGTLGTALQSANAGLRDFAGVPAIVVRSIGQIAAAAGPTFERFTAAASSAAAQAGGRLTRAFETGRMQAAIERAADLLGQLRQVFVNLGQVIRSVFSAAQVSGGGLIGTLQQITGALADAFASPAVQDGLRALFQTMATLAQTAAPLLGQALGLISPVLTALGPPVQELITSLGQALSPIIAALGPVLQAAAGAVGELLDAISPILPVIGQLVAGLLPPLLPLLSAVGDVFSLAAPVVQQLATALGTALTPVLAQLPALTRPVATVLTTLAQMVLPILAQLIDALAPSLARIGTAFGQLLAAAAPLLATLGQLATQTLAQLLPILTPVISLVARLASIFAGQLASAVNNVAVPALRLITALLRGDASAAWTALRALISGVVRYIVTTVMNMGRAIAAILGTVVSVMRQLPGRIFAALGALAGGLVRVAATALSRFRAAVESGGSRAVAWVRGLPGRIRGALGSLDGLLYGVGRDIVRGLLNGLSSLAGAVAAKARSLASAAASAARSALGIGSPSRVFAKIGRDTGRGFILGLTSTRAKIDQTADRIAASITAAFRGRRTGLDDRLVAMVQRNNTRLQQLAAARDRIAQRIVDARKFAADTAAQARGTGALSQLVQPDFFAPRLIEQRLGGAAGRIRAFTNSLITLRKRGLRRDLLRQLLEMGPQAGADFARALVLQGEAGIKRFNALQARLVKESVRLGRFGADALFDSGARAGAGFLAGLKAQQKSIEALMLRIAKGMQRAIRRALGIKSPSTVMAEVGRLSTLGVAAGLVRPLPQVQRAMGAVSQAIASGVSAPAAVRPAAALTGLTAARSARRPGAAPLTVHVTVENHGVLGSEHEVMDWLTSALDTLARTRRLPAAVGG